MKSLIAVLSFGILLGAISALTLGYQLFFRISPVTYVWAMDQDNGSEPLCEAIILESPHIDAQAVTKFVQDAILSLNDYDYLSWKHAIPEVLDTYFSTAAGRDYLEKYSRSSLRSSIEGNYYTVTARSAGSTYPPVITEEGVEAGRRYWIVQTPIEITYSPSSVITGDNRLGNRTTTARTFVANQVFIVRVVEQAPSDLNYRGLAIADIRNKEVRNFFDFDIQDR